MRSDEELEVAMRSIEGMPWTEHGGTQESGGNVTIVAQEKK
jgi:hypothetical protein